MFNEYPKALHPDGDIEREVCIVFDAAQEAEKRKEGYRLAGEPQAEKKRGRPAKGE